VCVCVCVCVYVCVGVFRESQGAANKSVVLHVVQKEGVCGLQMSRTATAPPTHIEILKRGVYLSHGIQSICWEDVYALQTSRPATANPTLNKFLRSWVILL